MKIPVRATWACVSMLLVISESPPTQGQDKTFTAADYIRARDENKNWGRWGANDEKGTSNLIDSAKIRSAANLVRHGIVVSLARPVPQQQESDVPPNSVFVRTVNGTAIGATVVTDNYMTRYHGFSTTHMDANCHWYFNNVTYNNNPAPETITFQEGCKKNSILARKDGTVTRAVIYDIPWLKGVDWLEPGTAVTRADLEAFERSARVRVEPGDVYLLYVGHWKRRKALGPLPVITFAGNHPEVSEFLKERDVAFIGHDAGQEVNPRLPGLTAAEGVSGDPVHIVAMYTMGAGVLDNLDMDKAVEVARRLRRWEAMIVFAPWRVIGGTGSPLNPLLVF